MNPPSDPLDGPATQEAGDGPPTEPVNRLLDAFPAEEGDADPGEEGEEGWECEDAGDPVAEGTTTRSAS